MRYLLWRVARTQHCHPKRWRGCAEIAFASCCGKARWRSCFGRHVGGHPQTKQTLATQTSNHVPSYLPKGVEHLRPHQSVRRDAYSSFPHTCQNLEATQMPLSRCADKETVLHPDNATLLSANKTVVTKSRKTGRRPNAHHQVEEASVKRPHPIRFQV